MDRDGSCKSLWQTTVNTYPSVYRFPRESAYDVAIVGGGITGITLALMLQESGKDCVLIEAHQLGFGSTGGTTAHINTFLDNSYSKIAKDFSEQTAGMVAQAVQDSISLIKRNVGKYNISCSLEDMAGYVFSRSDDQTAELEEIVSYCQKLGVLAEFIDVGENDPTIQCIAKFEGQAQFNPLKYIQALAQQFEKKGGTILQYCRMESMEQNGQCLLQTSLGALKAKQVVYATHIPPGVNVLHTLNAAYRSYVLGVSLLQSKEMPAGLMYDMEEPYHYYRRFKDKNQDILLIGGADHKTGDEETENAYNELKSYALKNFHIREIVYKWSSQYYESADGLAYIGELPGSEADVFVATGFGGNGMIYGSMAALILHDLIIKGDSEYEKIFNPKRVKPLASFSKFVAENADVAKELVKGKLSRERIEAFVELSFDEGRVVEYEGEKMGLYKDPVGNIFAVDPICPHMKCVVKWNQMEKSWDCPCHGSRFSYTGELLNGPAKHNLDIVQLQKQTSL